MLVDWMPILTFFAGAWAKPFAPLAAIEKIRSTKARSIIVHLRSDATLITRQVARQAFTSRCIAASPFPRSEHLIWTSDSRWSIRTESFGERRATTRARPAHSG